MEFLRTTVVHCPVFVGFLVSICVSYPCEVQSQPGVLDPSFVPADGSPSLVYTLAVQNNGGVLLGGEFEHFMIRLSPDGSRDTSFDEALSVDGEVLSICIQEDDQILIAGTFSQVNGASRSRIARLLSDGRLDTQFDPGGGADGTIHALISQSDHKTVLCGEFMGFNGIRTSGLIRLNPDGTEDTNFISRPGPDAALFSGAIQRDAKILIMGSFRNVHSIPRSRICRLNSDGTVDLGFEVDISGSVQVAAEQADGKIVVGGTFTSVGGIPRNYVARLHSDGSLDESFQPGAGPDHWVINAAIQPDGKIIIGGYFMTVAGQLARGIARLKADGSLDRTFNSGTGVGGIVLDLALQSDGRIFITGGFGEYNGVPRLGTALVFGDLILWYPRLVNGYFEVLIHSITGKVYSLERKNDLTSSADWELVSTIQGDGRPLSLTDIPSNTLKSFYRVKLE